MMDPSAPCEDWGIPGESGQWRDVSYARDVVSSGDLGQSRRFDTPGLSESRKLEPNYGASLIGDGDRASVDVVSYEKRRNLKRPKDVERGQDRIYYCMPLEVGVRGMSYTPVQYLCLLARYVLGLV